MCRSGRPTSIYSGVVLLPVQRSIYYIDGRIKVVLPLLLTTYSRRHSIFTSSLQVLVARHAPRKGESLPVNKEQCNDEYYTVIDMFGTYGLAGASYSYSGERNAFDPFCSALCYCCSSFTLTAAKSIGRAPIHFAYTREGTRYTRDSNKNPGQELAVHRSATYKLLASGKTTSTD